MNEDIDHDEWKVLYDAVQAVCAKYGTEDPYGTGDYWLVDDNWGGVSQKLVVSSPSFLTPALVAELAACIEKTQLYGAQILVALELNASAGKLPPMMGLLIGSQGATEEWDLAQIRAEVGEAFYTDRPS
ncbi:MAG: hypothetical protein ACK515_01700 [bacterium]|jgi:hypothetical protein|nr:hypothetical protein [Betaproteobacteria bacterium]